MFRPLPGHHQANKETVLIKVHSLANECNLINTSCKLTTVFICCVTTAHYNKLVIRTKRDGVIQIVNWTTLH